MNKAGSEMVGDGFSKVLNFVCKNLGGVFVSTDLVLTSKVR
jgi:hypothetical protein